MKPTFEELLCDAREHQPDTAAAELGFETRLAATIRELSIRSEDGFLDVFGNWLWRSAFGLVPVVALLIAFAFIYNGFSIPNGADGIVSYVVDALPEPTLFVR